MLILDVEFQFDHHKLTVFYESERRVDFRELVSELFSLYKTRIWMQQVHRNEIPVNAPGARLCANVERSNLFQTQAKIGAPFNTATRVSTRSSPYNPSVRNTDSINVESYIVDSIVDISNPELKESPLPVQSRSFDFFTSSPIEPLPSDNLPSRDGLANLSADFPRGRVQLQCPGDSKEQGPQQDQQHDSREEGNSYSSYRKSLFRAAFDQSLDSRLLSRY